MLHRERYFPRVRSKSSKRVTEIRALRTHTQSLSGRSLGGLDRAAALPGMRRHGKRDGSLQESRQEEVNSSVGEKLTSRLSANHSRMLLLRLGVPPVSTR